MRFHCTKNCLITVAIQPYILKDKFQRDQSVSLFVPTAFHDKHHCQRLGQGWEQTRAGTKLKINIRKGLEEIFK